MADRVLPQPQPLSIPTFSEGQQSPRSVESDSFLERGNSRRSGGRDQFVEGKSDRRGGSDYTKARGASWGSTSSFESRGWGTSPKFRAPQVPGSGSDSPNWRSGGNRFTPPESAGRNGSGRGLGRGHENYASGNRVVEERRRGGRGNYARGNSSPLGNNNESEWRRGPGHVTGLQKDRSPDSPSQGPSSSRGWDRGNAYESHQATRNPPRGKKPVDEELGTYQNGYEDSSSGNAKKTQTAGANEMAQTSNKQGLHPRHIIVAEEEVPKTPPSRSPLRADAAEFNPSSSKSIRNGFQVPQIQSLRAEAAEFSPESPKGSSSEPASPLTTSRRSTDWYEICLEEEQEEQLQALANREVLLNSPSPPRGESSFGRKSSLSRNSSGRKLDDAGTNGPKKDFRRNNSFGRTPNGNKGDENVSKRELRRNGSFSTGDMASPSASKGKFGRRHNSFNRDPVGELAAGSARGEFKPWNSSSVREDATDSAEQRNVDSGRGDKYIPLPLRNKGRNEPSNLKPSFGRKFRDGSPREENGRWRKGNDEETSAPAMDTKESTTEIADVAADQKNILSVVRPATFSRALIEATAKGGDKTPQPHTEGNGTDVCPVKDRLPLDRLRDVAAFELVKEDLKMTSKAITVRKVPAGNLMAGCLIQHNRIPSICT